MRASIPGSTAAAAAVALTVSTLLLALSPALALLARHAGDTSPLQILGWSVCGVLGLLTLTRKIWIGLALLAPWALLAPFETWYILDFGKPSDAHLFGILAEADRHEISAFAGSHVVLIAVTICTVAVMLSAAVLSTRRARLAWPARGRRALLSLCAAGLASPWIVDWAVGDTTLDPVLPQQFSQEGDDLARQGIDPALEPFAKAYPAGVVLRFAEFSRYRRTLAALDQRLANFRFGAQVSAEPTLAKAARRQVHVLVIGEAGRPDRWQVNGYERATSPRLAAMPNLVSFTDMVSPWSWTRMSVPVILSRKPGTETRPFFAERSLVAAYREAGFRTYWVSTQSPVGPHDSSISLYARESHELRFVNPGSYKEAAALDGDLLSPLDTILARLEPRQLIVLHTLGSHYNYSHRYPVEFDVFRPSLRNQPAPSLHDRGQRVAMGNAYDNSILYTDHLLAEVIGRLKRLDAVATMFYVADHGENLFDGDCAVSGHGRNTERDHRVAAFFWHSGAYAAAYPDKPPLAHARRNAPLSTENIFHSLLDAADITYPGEKLTASIFSPQWHPGPRPVQSGVDFDTAQRVGPCLELKR